MSDNKDFAQLALWIQLKNQYDYSGKVSKTELNFLLKQGQIPEFANEMIRESLNGRIFKRGESKFSFMDKVAIGLEVEKARREHCQKPNNNYHSTSALDEAKNEIAESLGMTVRGIEKILSENSPTIKQAINMVLDKQN